MAARQASAQLLMLERLNYGLSYRFIMEPHERLEKRLLEWASYRIYGVCIEYDAVQAGKKIYTISSDGMWLLSHLFSNWEEMDKPPSQPKIYQCDACHLYSGSPPWQCPECKKMFCSYCASGHAHFAREAEERFTGRRCVSCRAREMRHDAFIRCPQCDKVYCPGCYAIHIYEESREDVLYTYRQYFWTSAAGTNTQTRSIPANVREALKVLGVAESSVTVAEITATYKQLAKEQHPDRGGDTKRMAEINHARDVALKWAKEQQGRKA